MAASDRPAGCPAHINAEIWDENPWPTDEPFPLTPEECLWLLMGYAVLPLSGPMTADVRNRLPGKIELIDGWLVPG